MNIPQIISVKCNHCSGFVHPAEGVRIGESVVLCQKCYETHSKAVDAFDPPACCVGCLRSWEQLKGDAAGTHVSMFAAWRDGEYTLLCKKCDDAYVQKRKDLYGNTRHGWKMKLK